MDDDIPLISRGTNKRRAIRSPTRSPRVHLPVAPKPLPQMSKNSVTASGSGEGSNVSQSIVKKLYGVPGHYGTIVWHETMPRHFLTPSDFSGHAMVFRYLADEASDTRVLRLDSILICSPFLEGSCFACSASTLDKMFMSPSRNSGRHSIHFVTRIACSLRSSPSMTRDKKQKQKQSNYLSLWHFLTKRSASA